MIDRLLLAVTIVLTLCSCEDNRPTVDQETAKSGRLEIYVDDQIADIVEPSLELFQKEHPQAVLTMKRIPAADAVMALVSREARLAVIARGLLPSEDTLRSDANATFPMTHIATDALVIIANRSIQIDTLSDEQLRAWLVGDTKTISTENGGARITSLICPSPASSVFDNVNTLLLRGRRPVRERLTSLPDAASVVNAVRGNPSVLGVTYLSQVHSDSSVKLLRIGFTNEKGFRVYPQHVHLGYIVQKMYPYPVKIHTVLRDKISHFSLPAGVAGYIYQNADAQRTFLNAGIVPEFAKLVLDPTNP